MINNVSWRGEIVMASAGVVVTATTTAAAAAAAAAAAPELMMLATGSMAQLGNKYKQHIALVIPTNKMDEPRLKIVSVLAH